MTRLSQAISEGDGISVIPLLAGDVAAQAALAEEAGAEAVAVSTGDAAEAARAATGLPILVRAALVDLASADGCVLVFEHLAGGEELEDLHALALEHGLDCVVDVRDEEELAEALDRIDPQILLLSERDRDRDEEVLERTLDLLADVPAGKLVISESGPVAREQVLALERAGVDAVLVTPGAAELRNTVLELTGGRAL